MLEKLKQLENKYLELSARAEQPDFYADPARAAKFLKEQRELAPSFAEIGSRPLAFRS